ncbi:MAG: hypothetical protein KY437_10335 [Actinobacteria bacterium]|nr:hypothetical protein [Actinomycetota bacterium]
MSDIREVQVRLLLIVMTLGLLTACGGSPPPVVSDPGVRTATYTCGSVTLTPRQLDEAPPADDLDADARAALDGVEVPPIDPGDGWVVLSATSVELAMIRELDEPQGNGPGDVRTHEFLAVRTSEGATNVPDGAWVLDATGTCTPRIDLGELGAADLVLAEEPSPDDREVRLAVFERACASGRSADGRVEVVRQTLTDDQLRLVVGVRAASGAQECPGNPATPVTIELDDPLGERTVVDATTLPPQQLPVDEVHEPASADGDEVERALAYEPPPSYVMEVTVECFCPAGRFRVTVEDGEKVEVAMIDPVREEGQATAHLDLAPTIADIQDRLRDTVDGGGEVLEIATADDGRPIRVSLDPIPNAIDDEVAYEVARWEPGTGQ